MVVTVDTNIVFQGLYSNKGASNMILRLIRNEQVRLALSVPVFLKKKMSKAQVITVRIPEDLKKRLERIAKKQGVSVLCQDLS